MRPAVAAPSPAATAAERLTRKTPRTPPARMAEADVRIAGEVKVRLAVSGPVLRRVYWPGGTGGGEREGRQGCRGVLGVRHECEYIM